MYKIFFLFCFSMSLIALEPILPIDIDKNIDENRVLIGKMLFNDVILSRNKKISCASCHKPSHFYSDNKKYSVGIYGRIEDVNTPTVLNAIYNFKQFWNGKANSISEQLSMTLHNKVEMDISDELLIKRISSKDIYRKLFKKTYNIDKIEMEHIKDALKSYMQTLTTPDSKFDRFLKGKAVLNNKEKKGYTLFKRFGCIVCHNGKNVGGNSYQKMGIIIPIKKCQSDLYVITKDKNDKCVYKVPTLRNIEMTAPYFHDGRAKTLKEAIKIMGYNNLGIMIEEDDIEYIEEFLKTLTGKIK